MPLSIESEQTTRSDEGAAVTTAMGRWKGLRRPRWRSYHLEHVLGTSLELRVIARTSEDGDRAEAAVLDEIDRLSAILSGYSADSELARWQATFDADVLVSPELAEVLDLAEGWRVRTNGAFHPAAQAVIEHLQAGMEIDDLLARRNEPLCSVDRGRGVARRTSRLRISLDAIAKGYIVARSAALALNADGVSDVLLNIGGDVQHFGSNAVTVGIADPLDAAENAPPLTTVRIRNEAMATSGGYRRGFVVEGRRCSHIVDPRSGSPADHIASASVIAPDCATADALSTAFSVLPPSESLALADSLAGVACLLVGADGAIHASADWTRREPDAQRR